MLELLGSIALVLGGAWLYAFIMGQGRNNEEDEL